MKLKNNKSLRILHAPCEIAGQMGIISRAQRQVDTQAYSCAYHDTWLKTDCDWCFHLERLKSSFHRGVIILFHFPSFLFNFNTYHFHFGCSLLPWNLDLCLFKILRKKMVMHYWGSDIRIASTARKNNKFAVVKNVNEAEIINKVKRVARFIDVAIAGSYDLCSYVEPFFKKVYMVRVAIDLDSFIFQPPELNKKKPLIVHAPSDEAIKGTDFVLQAINKLKNNNYSFDFKLVHKLTHKEALEIYQKADIVVDQLLLGGHGVFAVECMAMGKPVICYISEKRRNQFPEDLPIISASPKEIYQRLELLLTNPILRREAGFRGRKYVEKYHDSHLIAEQLIKIYKSL